MGSAGGLPDLHTLVMTGSVECSERHFAAQLTAAGFKVLDVGLSGVVRVVVRAGAH